MSAILKFDFQKKETITVFWSKLSKLHKKDPILHVTTTFSLKQGETRTNSVLIPHPLNPPQRVHRFHTEVFNGLIHLKLLPPSEIIKINLPQRVCRVKK